MTDETIQDRAERAQSQEMEITLIDTEPVVVQVYNEDSDRIHTVVPDSIHCSCEDHTYRGIICKHLLVLLQEDGHIGDQTREALKQKRNDLGESITEAQERLDELRSQRNTITEALSAVGAMQISEESVGDIIDGIQAEAEARSEAEDEPSPFEQMVDDLALDEEEIPGQ